MAEIKVMKSRRVPLKVGDTEADIFAANRAARAFQPLESSPVGKARGDVFSTINERQRTALGEDYGQGFTSGENYQPPMAPADIGWDLLKSIPPTATSVAESTAGALGDVADSRYALAHYLNRKLSGGTENRTADNWLDTIEKYDPVSAIPNSEDVAAATDPIYEALGIKDDLRYQPRSPWGEGLFTAGQFADPFAAGSKAANITRKVLKGGR